MATCPECNQEIPKGKNKIPLLACPRCMAVKGYQSILDFQRQFLTQIRQGDLPMILTKSAEDFRWHIKLTGYLQGWCGETLNPRWGKKYAIYPGIDKATPVCERCREVFEGMAEERPTEVA